MGEWSTDGLPTGTVTFLLTEVEGSTRSWEHDSTTIAAAISRHYEILDEVIARRHGHRPVQQGEGVSVAAVFARASDAVEAALDADRAVDELGLRIRIAVHSGEIELRDDGNYFGPTIIRCARLLSIGHGGQLLLSDATRQLVGDRLPAGASLQDLGQHRLKDLAHAERVWQVSPAERPEVFPPLRSLDAFGHNLPTRLTPLIGRVYETASVTSTVAAERLVTLTGAGGVGKTTLALHAAAELVDRFDGGVWWVDLAPVNDPGSMPGAALTAMGVPQRPGVSAAAALVDQLAGRSALFVLDNCEHLVARCAAFVEELLTSTSTIRVLATSREALGVPGEVVWHVPSMGVPAADEPATAASIIRFDAARLFVDRAQRARHSLELTDEVAPAVARICARLDGIPLSIELAAARCRSLGVDQIARELDERFRLLTGGTRAGTRQTADVEGVDRLEPRAADCCRADGVPSPRRVRRAVHRGGRRGRGRIVRRHRVRGGVRSGRPADEQVAACARRVARSATCAIGCSRRSAMTRSNDSRPSRS